MKYPRILKVYVALFVTSCTFAISAEAIEDDTSNHYVSNCGANSLYVVLRMNGKDISLEDILSHDIVKQKHPNLSLLDLVKISGDHDCKMVPVRISCDQLLDLKYPFIVHLAEDPVRMAQTHFAVGWAKGSPIIELIDYPRRLTLTCEEILRHYTGHALISAAEEILEVSPTAASIDQNTTSCQKSDCKKHVDVTNPAEKYPVSVPRLTWIGENDIDVGDLFEEGDSTLAYYFRFQNTGGEPLLIDKTQSSCSCADIKLSMYSIDPGQYGTLSVTVERNTEGPFMEHVRLKTNDPDNPIAHVSIKGVYVPLVDVKLLPNSVSFGAVDRNAVHTRSITLHNDIKNARQQELQINQIETDFKDHVTVSINRDWTMDSEGIRTCELEIKLQHDLPPGTYVGRITLKCDPKDMAIPISFVVEPNVVSKPTTCLLSSSIPSRTIDLATKLESGFSVDHISVNVPWLKVSWETDPSKALRRHSLNISLEDTKEDLKGVVKASVKVSGLVDNEPWEQTIPVIFAFSE